MNKFFYLPNGSVVPLIPKCGLASTHSAIFKHLIKGGNLNHKLLRPVFKHDNKPALAPIRDAVERFKSAVYQVNKGDQSITVNKILDGLEAGTYRNQHFQSQTDILKGCEGCESVKLYRFPEDFQQMLTDGGLDPLSDHRNKSTDKPELTEEQETRVRALYADDIALRATLDADVTLTTNT
jgi:hypothetical protein